MTRLPLPQVTLCAVDCQSPALAALALLRADQRLGFGRVLLFTQGWLPTVVLPRLQVVDIEPLRDDAAVADFVIRRLHAYVASSHALVLRWDAGVLDASAWNDEFLVHDHLAVDDGSAVLPGLSLRSRRFLRAGADPRLTEPQLDDALMTGARRGFLEEVHGMAFAPPALQRRFASAAPASMDGGRPFGFVGARHLPALLGEAETLELLRRLPPEWVLGPACLALEAALREQGMVQALRLLAEARARFQAAAARLAAA
jgi:hypothetical protein